MLNLRSKFFFLLRVSKRVFCASGKVHVRMQKGDSYVWVSLIIIKHINCIARFIWASNLSCGCFHSSSFFSFFLCTFSLFRRRRIFHAVFNFFCTWTYEIRKVRDIFSHSIFRCVNISSKPIIKYMPMLCKLCRYTSSKYTYAFSKSDSTRNIRVNDHTYSWRLLTP